MGIVGGMNSYYHEKEELESRSKFKGHILLESRHSWYREPEKVPFIEITHYFNSDMQELGYVTFEGTRFQNVHLFNPPRVWAKEFLDNCQITPIIH